MLNMQFCLADTEHSKSISEFVVYAEFMFVLPALGGRLRVRAACPLFEPRLD